jgi:hypothetical protein
MAGKREGGEAGQEKRERLAGTAESVSGKNQRLVLIASLGSLRAPRETQCIALRIPAFLLPRFPALPLSRHSNEPHHSSLCSARSTVAIKIRSVVGGAPTGVGELSHPQFLGLLRQAIAQVQFPRSRAIRRYSAAGHHFRTYFITPAAYADATVHYDVLRSGSCHRGQALDPSTEDASCRSPPTRVQQRDSAIGGYQVDRNAVGDGYRQQDSRSGADPTIDPVDLDPSGAAVDAHDLGAVHLLTDHYRIEAAHLPAEGQPSTHDFADRLRAPESEIEAAAGLSAATSDPGNDPVALSPTGDFESGDGPWNGDFAQFRCMKGRTLCGPTCAPAGVGTRTGIPTNVPCLPASRLTRFPASTHPLARSPLPTRAAARRSARSLARSGRRCGSCWALRRPERRAAWPYRLGCRATRRCRP